MKFILDESGAKSYADKNEIIGVIAGFFLKDTKIEDKLILRCNEILKEISTVIEDLKKMHISELYKKNVEEAKKIEEKIFEVINELEIVWTFSCIKKGEEIHKQKKEKHCFREGTLLEMLYMRIFVNVIDYLNSYSTKEKLKNIKLITDTTDKSLLECLGKYLNNIFNSERTLILTDGYNTELKMPNKYVELKAIQPVDEEIKDFIDNFKLEIDDSENQILSFVADIIVYRTYQVLKNLCSDPKISEGDCTKKEYMIEHPCKFLFILGEVNEKENFFWKRKDL